MPACRIALASLALLSTACARNPEPMSLGVEATVECVVSVVTSRGFREEARWRGPERNSVHIRLRRGADELTVSVQDPARQGRVSVGYSYPSGRSAGLESEVGMLGGVVRNRCLP